MKKMFLITSLMSGGMLFAQSNDTININQRLLEKYVHRPVFTQPMTIDEIRSLAKSYRDNTTNYDSFIFPDGSTTMTIPQGTMPCVVPVITLYNMPNAVNTSRYHDTLLERYGKAPAAADPYKTSQTIAKPEWLAGNN